MLLLKRVLTYLFFITLFILFIKCNEKNLPENDQFYGSYKAVTFFEPGQLDGGVDILAKGGNLTAELTSDYKVKGYLYIPDSIGSNYSAQNTNYSGSFTLKADTLHFINTNTFLDNPQLFFIVKQKQLKTPEYSGRWKLFKIILQQL